MGPLIGGMQDPLRSILEKRRCVIFFRDNGGRVLLLSLMKNVFCACAPPKLSRYIFFPLNGIIVVKLGTDAK